MESFRIAKEILDYAKQFRGKLIVVKVSKKVLANNEKLSNVIKDISLLRDEGIRIVVTYSGEKLSKDLWSSLEPVTFLDISTILGISGCVAVGATPVVHFGEEEYLSSEKAIASLAISLRAIKIVYVTNYNGIFQAGKALIKEINIEQARQLLDEATVTQEMKGRVEAALMACEQGIPRIHIIGANEGSLLNEILTCEGSGTMIYDSIYHEIRRAKKSDVLEIFDIIYESIKKFPAPLDFIEGNMRDFLVFAVDRQIQGCMMIRSTADDDRVVEISYLAASAEYEKPEVFQRLIEYALAHVEDKVECIFLDQTKNTNLLGIYPWFKKLGFEKGSLGEDYGKTITNYSKLWVNVIK